MKHLRRTEPSFCLRFRQVRPARPEPMEQRAQLEQPVPQERQEQREPMEPQVQQDRVAQLEQPERQVQLAPME